MHCEIAPKAGSGPAAKAGETLSGLAAAIDAVVDDIEEDWRTSRIVRRPAADRLHELVEAARRLAGGNS